MIVQGEVYFLREKSDVVQIISGHGGTNDWKTDKVFTVGQR